ncbi:DUF58 domain-containing protein [Paenibacillus sp. LS1]|uniref:DUF58 domain-containing protein n=1 Tax=Paenibacillus sp. LS1 TaxID=2992120 RepID=UPI00222E1D97|nr:DUF58 domain-containing protein [Paenibacillus sp. LS1]MCW3792706.1 DUF58 domain-containing protein [Paenibacillus sp. LS1]
MALLWLVLVGGIVVGIHGVWFGRPALRKLKYSRQFSKLRCYAGDELEMVETISNEKRVSVPWLRLEAMMPVSFVFRSGSGMDISQGEIYQNHKSIFTLKPFTRITRKHPFSCTQRGIYPLNTASMTGGDLFGVWRSTKPIPLHMSMVVYPSLVNAEDLPAIYQVWQGEVEVSRWIVEDPFLILGVRPYGAGDPMNRIHWKASARTGELQVYKQGWTADPQSWIVVNIQESADMWSVVTRPEKIERALRYAATAAVDAISRGLPAGFAHNGYHVGGGRDAVRIEPDYGTPHLERVLEAMAETELKCMVPMEQFLNDEVRLNEEAQQIRSYLLITSYVSAAMEHEIARLHEQGHCVTVLPVEDVKGATKAVSA